MTKHYCDRCEREMFKSENGKRLAGNDNTGRFGFEVMVYVDGICNGGHLCHDCVRAIIEEKKPKKRAKR